MKQQGVTGVEQALSSLASVPQSKLDELTADQLRTATLDEVARSGGFTEVLADRVDGVITVRLVRLLRSPHTSSADFRTVDDLIAGVARDKFAHDLDGHPKRYYSRWQGFREVLNAARRLEDFQVAVRETKPQQPDNAWELVAETVLDAGPEGLALADMSKQLLASPSGPNSKSGVSQLVTSMRAHAWIDTVTYGRTKRLFAGANIVASSAWRKHQERVGRVPPTTGGVRQNASRSEDLSNFAELARRVVCLNQGAYIDFSYVAHEHHRELRELLVAPSNRDESADQRSTAVSHRARELLRFLDSSFKSVALQNFKLLVDHHFKGRSEVAPRICIKGNWSRNAGEENIVAPIIRDDGSSGDFTTSLADDNTGFLEVIRQGCFYSNQDIARAALLRTYRNPRLNSQQLEALRGRLDLDTVESGHGFTADDWLRCWADWKESEDPRKFYRSTLIIPMTLRNNNLSDEFRERLSQRVPQFDLSSYDRSILGFLCLDHPQAGFFNDVDDVALGYMVADCLSLYTFTRIALTTLSKVFQRTWTAAEFKQWMDELKHQVVSLQAAKNSPVLAIESTPKNQMIGLYGHFADDSGGEGNNSSEVGALVGSGNRNEAYTPVRQVG